MAEFIQIHMLTCYAPSNLNRDDLGRPKTAKMGGVDRLRISSQSLKRAWRTSDLFQKTLGQDCYEAYGKSRSQSLAVPSRTFGEECFIGELCEGSLEESEAGKWSKLILSALGKLSTDKGKENQLKQVVAISPIEVRELESVIKALARGVCGDAADPAVLEIIKPQQAKKPDAKKLQAAIQAQVLKPKGHAVDLALFGRMLASSPAYNVEAAAQVAHALTVNRVVVEDDYFTAVDDLNTREEDAGSAYIGEASFGSGVFYSYICINKSLLVGNLVGDDDLAGRAIRALVDAAAQVAPTGKQNRFASRARALYVLAERGTQQPRQLSAAFLKPVDDEDTVHASVKRLETLRDNMDKAYGKCSDESFVMNVEEPEENAFTNLLDFVAK